VAHPNILSFFLDFDNLRNAANAGGRGFGEIKGWSVQQEEISQAVNRKNNKMTRATPAIINRNLKLSLINPRSFSPRGLGLSNPRQWQVSIWQRNARKPKILRNFSFRPRVRLRRSLCDPHLGQVKVAKKITFPIVRAISL